MAKKKKNKDLFFELLNQVVLETALPEEEIRLILEAGVAAGYKKDTGFPRRITMNIVKEQSRVHFYIVMDIVEHDEDVEDPNTQMSLGEAHESDPSLKVGDAVLKEIFPEKFSRIASQTAKQVIMQRLNELKQQKVREEMGSKEGEILTGVIRRIEGNVVFLEMSGNQMEGVMMANDQIPGEKYNIGSSIKVYVKYVRDNQRGGSQVIVTRSQGHFVKKLFEWEVPEIKSNLIEIKSVARDAGNRTKISVEAVDETIVDPVGSCIGPKGSRINTIIQEINGEKIDVIPYSDNVGQYISSALSPAPVIAVQLNQEAQAAVVVVPDDKLSLAIGRKGQNVRLAARLTGWKIDIQPYSALVSEFGSDSTAATEDAENTEETKKVEKAEIEE